MNTAILLEAYFNQGISKVILLQIANLAQKIVHRFEWHENKSQQTREAPGRVDLHQDAHLYLYISISAASSVIGKRNFETLLKSQSWLHAISVPKGSMTCGNMISIKLTRHSDAFLGILTADSLC